MKRVGAILILMLAFFGLADSLYLTQHELSGTPLLCNIQNLSGCNVVTTSQYSHVFGIPLAEFGIVFYGMMFILAALEIVLFNQLLRRILQSISLLGVLSSLYFIFVQVFFIGAFCIYCLASAFITFLILILASLIEPIRRREYVVSPPVPLSVFPASELPTNNLEMPPKI